MNYLLAFCIFISVSSAFCLARANGVDIRNVDIFRTDALPQDIYFCDTAEEIILDFAKGHSVEGVNLSKICSEMKGVNAPSFLRACESVSKLNCDN